MSEAVERVLLLLDTCPAEQAYFREIARRTGLTYVNARRYVLEFEERGIVYERLPPKGAHHRSRFFGLTSLGRVLVSRPLARSFAYQGSGVWTRLNQTKVTILHWLRIRSSAEATRPRLVDELDIGQQEVYTAVYDLEQAHLVFIERTRRPYPMFLTPEGKAVATACGPPLPVVFFPPAETGGR